MRPFLRWIAVAIAFAVLSVPAFPPARAEAAMPAWSTGDFWAYQYTGNVFDWVLGPGAYRLDVLGTDTVAVGGVSYQAWRTRLTVNGSNVVQYHGGDRWYRTSDLALLKETYNVTATIFGFIEVGVLVTITYDPPFAIQWPLTGSRTWLSSSTVSTVTQFIGWPSPPPTAPLVDTTFLVEAASTVTVPAGTFETTPLQASHGDRTTTYWAPTAGNAARERETDQNQVETSSAELTSYQYRGPQSNFLGLPIIVWLLLIVLFAIIVVALVMRRRRPRGAIVPPPGPA